MKYIWILSLLFSTSLFSQNKTDADGLKQGFWHVNVPERYGEDPYQEEGYYKDGKKEGRWYHLSDVGDTLAIENYKYGYKNGTCKYYDLEGLVRIESWLAADPKNPYDTIDVYDLKDPDKITRKVVKIEGSSVKHGTWTYFYPGGRMIEKQEKYVLGAKQNDSPLPNKAAIKATGDSTAKKTTKIVPKEVLEYEKQNSGKKKIKVRDGATGL